MYTDSFPQSSCLLLIIYSPLCLSNVKTIVSSTCAPCSLTCFLSARSRPTITPEGPQLIVPLNDDFSLNCQSDSSVRWLREDRPTRNLREQRQGQVAVLKVSKAGPQHMGKYSCREEESGEKSSIYVYVKGKSAFCICESVF